MVIIVVLNNLEHPIYKAVGWLQRNREKRTGC